MDLEGAVELHNRGMAAFDLALGTVPLQEELRLASDEGRPLVVDDPDSPASQALRHVARGLIAVTPQESPLLQAASGPALEGVPEVTGTALPMAP